MSEHVTNAFGDVDSFTLFHNPTGGFLKDLFESQKQKLGWFTPIGQQFTEVLAGSQMAGGADFVTHSQGGIIFTYGMSQLRDVNMSLSNIRVQFNAGANNKWRTNFLAGKTGVTVIKYNDNFFDPVPQVVGLRGVLNPFKFFGSILASPLLFTDKSQHTHPNEE